MRTKNEALTYQCTSVLLDFILLNSFNRFTLKYDPKKNETSECTCQLLNIEVHLLYLPL